MDMRAIGLALVLGLSGCSGEEPPPPPPPPPPAPPPPPPKPEMWDIAALNAARDAEAGQAAKVKGFVTAVAKTDAAANATISATADGGESLTCVADPAAEADFTAAMKTEVMVTGTVAVADGATQLTGCAMAGGGKAKEGKEGKESKEGKEGKGKGGKH